MEGGTPPAWATVQLAEQEPHEGAGLADDPGLGNGGADLGNATHHGSCAENGDQPLACVDAILQRNDCRVGPYERTNSGAGALHVPQLDAEQNEIDRTDTGRLVGGLDGIEMYVPARPEHAETTRAQRVEVRAAR